MIDERKEIDAELWLQVLMMQFANERSKQNLIDFIVNGTGLTDNQVEEFLQMLARALVKITRSN